MPVYEFRCRACSDTFTVTRPMARSQDPAECPHGHDDTVRLLTTLGGFSSAAATEPAGGGCCGGGCCG